MAASLSRVRWVDESKSFLAFDLDDFRVMDEDFDRSIPKAFESLDKRLFDRRSVITLYFFEFFHVNINAY
jgi:hypothetical protein